MARSNVALAAGGLIKDHRQKSDRWHSHCLIADLSFLRFNDSSWIKGNDRLQVNLLWSTSRRKWTRAYSLLFATQFLPSERTAFSPVTETMEVERYGGFLAPAALELGYGATWQPWPQSTLQFNFASVRFASTPKAALLDPDREYFGQSERTVYEMLYGGSIVISINHSFGDRITWTNASRFFCNGLDRDHISFDFMNRLSIVVWKPVQLRLETRLAYDPMMSYNLVVRNEVLLGLFFSNPVKKN